MENKNFFRFLAMTTILFVCICVALSTSTDSKSASTQSTNPLETKTALASTVVEGVDTHICELDSVECEGEANVPIKRKDVSPVKIGASKEVQERVSYAWEISHDRDFLYTLEKENGGTWSTTITSSTNDVGICQINKTYHPKVVSDPRFKDWKWQLDTCWKMYKGNVRFYGYDVRYKVVNNFKWK